MLPPFVAVFVVLLLLLGVLWLARNRGRAAFEGVRLAWRFPKDRTPPQLQVIERIALTPQHSLHLVSCAGRLLLLGVSPGGVTALPTLTETEDGSRARGIGMNVAGCGR